jgi:anti-sigma factor RsiW
MNKCSDSSIQEMLPDLLHHTLPADARARVEAHLATCDECGEDLKVLRAVKSAAVFAPAIDVDRVVRQIPPYRTLVPGVELPQRRPMVQWLVAAAVAIVLVGGSVLMTRQKATDSLVVGPGVAPSGAVAESNTATTIPAPVNSPTSSAPSTPAHTHALALAADVDGLSDGSLVQLMSEMNRFDALPASESDPVISVDSGY